jgi:hypothetical protein
MEQSDSNDRAVEAVKPIAARRARDKGIAEARARADRIRRSLEGRRHSDSAVLIREDRDR